MAAYIVDEDLPRNLAAELRAAGFDAVDVRDVGLGGSPDPAVLAWAVSRARSIVTADMDFASIIDYPPTSHQGIIVARLPNEISVATMNERLIEAIRESGQLNMPGTLIIVELTRTRVRHP